MPRCASSATLLRGLRQPRPPVQPRPVVFLDPQSRRFYRDWNGIADATVGNLRAERDPYDRDLTDLVGQLSTQSEDFRIRWASHDVQEYRRGIQPFHHPLVGDLDLGYEALQLMADIGQILIVYTAQPGSPSHRDERVAPQLPPRRKRAG